MSDSDETFHYPALLEFDSDPNAIVNAHAVVRKRDVPTAVVLCFFRDVIDQVVERPDVDVVGSTKTEHSVHLLYELQHQGKRLGVFHPGIGAPLAAGMVEELIAMGCRTFIACGGAGALIPDLVLGHVVVPTSAVRDEGTSFHYLPPGRYVDAERDVVTIIEAVLDEQKVPYVVGRTWTTDGFYRETRGKADQRIEEGCVTVEMECSAFMAVAQFRGVHFGQLLYAGDTLVGGEWDQRGWSEATSIRQALFELACDVAVRADELPPLLAPL